MHKGVKVMLHIHTRRGIIKSLRKTRNNVLSGSAISVLGPRLFAGYVANMFANIPNILRSGDFRPLDKSMGIAAKQFRYRGATFFRLSVLR